MTPHRPTLIAPALIASRTRAALGYADIKVKDSNERIGIPSSTMARIVSPTNPRGASFEERSQIADACDVPAWFMEHGFDPLKETVGDDLQATTTRLLAEVKVIKAAMAQAGIDVPVARADLDAAVREAGRMRREELDAEDQDQDDAQFG